MKNMFAAILVAFCMVAVSSEAQTATVALNKSGTFIDGSLIKVTWKWNAAPVGAIVEIEMVSPLGFGYSILSDATKSGTTTAIARTLWERTEEYFIRVTWYNGTTGEVYDQAITKSFKISLPSNVAQRSVSIVSPTESTLVPGSLPLLIDWTATNLPDGALVLISARQLSSDISIPLARLSASAGQYWDNDISDLAEGWYDITVTYENEYGIGAQQDTVRVYISPTYVP